MRVETSISTKKICARVSAALRCPPRYSTSTPMPIANGLGSLCFRPRAITSTATRVSNIATTYTNRLTRPTSTPTGRRKSLKKITLRKIVATSPVRVIKSELVAYSVSNIRDKPVCLITSSVAHSMMKYNRPLLLVLTGMISCGLAWSAIAGRWHSLGPIVAMLAIYVVAVIVSVFLVVGAVSSKRRHVNRRMVGACNAARFDVFKH